MYRILSINPGSTSTKLAIYEDKKEILTENIVHPEEELEKFERIHDQYDYRKSAVLNWLKKNGYKAKDMDAIVGRGGLLPPIKSGAYKVNEEMLDYLKNRPRLEHPSNLAAIIAYEICEPLGIQAYIYDSVSVDEMEPIARISGIPEIERES